MTDILDGENVNSTVDELLREVEVVVESVFGLLLRVREITRVTLRN